MATDVNVIQGILTVAAEARLEPLHASGEIRQLELRARRFGFWPHGAPSARHGKGPRRCAIGKRRNNLTPTGILWSRLTRSPA